MNETVSAAPAPEPTGVRPGRELAAAREQCGYSVADVARHLKLSPVQVEAMEAEQYERLPGLIFTRGFIRNYARLVKLDPARLLADSATHPSSAPLPQPQGSGSVNIPFPTRPQFAWQRYALAGLVVLAALVVYEFYGDDKNEVTIKSRPVAQPGTQAAPEAPTGIAAPTVVPVVDTAPFVAGAAATRNKAERAASSGPASPARNAGAEHLVRLRFDRESWVEIRYRNGCRITSQLNPAGTELAVSGLPPRSLVVGNAASVRLTHNDQPVDLAPHIRVDVARLTLE
jgi:cytoskeleton protein RodZ